MKPKDLQKIWNAPDHSILTPKQVSVRLPILVAAKISAICEMFPNKTKTQVINDLLAAALDGFEESFEGIKGKLIHADESGAHFEDVGERAHFLRLAEKHLRSIEEEAKIEEPLSIPTPSIFESGDDS
ncbi:MAG: hypothetical protein ABFS35_22370 [Bacteroidota bacterium]